MNGSLSRTSLQPSFADLGRPLTEVTFCVVDLETTGAAETDRITEIGAVKVRGGEVLGEFQTLVDPGIRIPATVTLLTGIRNVEVATAPPLRAVLPSFLEFIPGCVLVAHNARFDVGFLRRACAGLEQAWPEPTVLDTVALARAILLRDEVPDHRLSTLARHLGARTEPNHRALADARATVDVLHALMERVGSLNVTTLEDLQEFARRVSPQRRRKRTWADGLPSGPGVYWFCGDGPHGEEVLYVGKSVDVRRRVRSYFTASEKRRRIDEMVQVATRVDATSCETALQAEVTELRMIAAHTPRYNRRSKFPNRLWWIKLTDEPFPRLSVVRAVGDDAVDDADADTDRGDGLPGAIYFGPVHGRDEADRIVAAVHDAFPIRRCSPRLSLRRRSSACALAELGRCTAPCDGSIGVEEYRALAGRVAQALTTDASIIPLAVRPRLDRLVRQQRYQEAGVLVGRLESLLAAGHRMHRVAAVARCPQIVAAGRLPDGGWEIHVIRYGGLAAAARSRPSDVPQAVARAALATASTVLPGPGPLPGGLFEEAERVAAWLGRPGVRIIELTGEWFWPVRAVVEIADLPALLGRPGLSAVLEQVAVMSDEHPPDGQFVDGQPAPGQPAYAADSDQLPTRAR